MLHDADNMETIGNTALNKATSMSPECDVSKAVSAEYFVVNALDI